MWIQIVQELPQPGSLVPAQPLTFDQMRQQGGEGASAQVVSSRLQPTADQVLALDQRTKNMRPARAVALDTVLVFKTLEQLLNCGEIGSGACGIETFYEISNRRFPTFPKDLKDCQFGICHVLCFSWHGWFTSE